VNRFIFMQDSEGRDSLTRKAVGRDKVHRLFYPVVPVIITSRLGRRVSSMPAISCTTLSFNPLLIGVAIAPSHSSHEAVEESGYFAVNWLDYVHFGKIDFMATVSGREVQDKVTSAGLTVANGIVTPTATIKEAVAVIECAVREKRKTGDHDLFIGECVAAYADEDFTDYWSYRGYAPILYVGSESTVFGKKYTELPQP